MKECHFIIFCGIDLLPSAGYGSINTFLKTSPSKYSAKKQVSAAARSCFKNKEAVLVILYHTAHVYAHPTGTV